jgi:hypothetical protein
MRVPSKSIIACCILVLQTVTPLPAATAAMSPLLATIMTNYGGQEQLAAIRSITAKGQIVDLRKGKEGPYRLVLTTDHRFRSESLVTPSSSGEMRVVDNDRGWRNSGLQMVPQLGADLAALRAQYEACALPLTLLDPKLSLTYDAPNIVQNHPVETYRLTRPGAPVMTIHFDAVSLLIHRVEWQSKNDTSLAIEFSDYRFVGGVLFPFKLVNYADDIKVSEVSIKTIDLNGPLPASTFRP